jgi:hypothetical protein
MLNNSSKIKKTRDKGEKRQPAVLEQIQFTAITPRLTHLARYSTGHGSKTCERSNFKFILNILCFLQHILYFTVQYFIIFHVSHTLNSPSISTIIYILLYFLPLIFSLSFPFQLPSFAFYLYHYHNQSSLSKNNIVNIIYKS